jgi:hypothetical protein
LERLELDGFLKAHGIYEDVTLADIERDVADLKAALAIRRISKHAWNITSAMNDSNN